MHVQKSNMAAGVLNVYEMPSDVIVKTGRMSIGTLSTSNNSLPFSTDPKILQNEIINIENWCIAIKLVLNYSKTFQVIFKAQTKDATVRIT